MNLFKRTTPLLFVSLIASVTNSEEMRYQFHQLLLESEVIIDENLTNVSIHWIPESPIVDKAVSYSVNNSSLFFVTTKIFR